MGEVGDPLLRSGEVSSVSDVARLNAVGPHAGGASRKKLSRCWGIGLGRTGTRSFCHALAILGYRNIGHNPRFESLTSLLGGADNGVVLFYKYLDFRYPASKFVLTLRDLPSWLASIEHVIKNYAVPADDWELAVMRRVLIYETVDFDRGKFISAYQRHHDDVRRYFRDRPGKLLEMNIIEGDGWDKLCPFLELPVPAEPFPHYNKLELATAGSQAHAGRSLVGAPSDRGIVIPDGAG